MPNKGAIAGFFITMLLFTGVFAASSPQNSNGSSGSSNAADTVMTVNGMSVDRAEFSQRAEGIAGSLAEMQAAADSGGEGTEMLEAQLNMLEPFHPEDLAIASLILDLGLYDEAINRGHLPPEELVEQEIEQGRMMIEAMQEDPEAYGVEPAQLEEYVAHIESFEGDTYWEEVYPQEIEQQYAMQQLQAELQGAGDGTNDPMMELQREVADSADVQIIDADFVSPGTVDGAEAYLDSFLN